MSDFLRMYFVKTPWYLKSVYPSLIWDLPKQGTLYLTFDDGPVPGVTDQVLDILKDTGVRATFFCIGDNVKKHPELFARIQEEGHITANHTFHHLNGWKTENETYFEDVQLCDTEVKSELFRPPYGRISYNQIQELKKDFKIIMWDVLSGDFDTTIDAATCTENVIANATDGSIIVFHDSEKAKERVLNSLPVIIKYFKEKGFVFESIKF